VNHQYGALVPMVGTVLTSLIALLIAVPASFGIAMVLTELAPDWLRRPLVIAIGMLAAIPSIIYGMWGLFVFVPLFQRYVQPYLIDWFFGVPVLNAVLSGPPFGIGLFTSGLILPIMMPPFNSSVSRCVFEALTPMRKESGYGLGRTTWVGRWRCVIPFTRNVVIGGSMLGLGRSVG